MATILRTLCLLFLFCLISQGNCCEPVKELKISQAPTGRKIRNIPEWKVTILNDCICSQLQIKLSCDGFQSVENIDPKILAKTSGGCLLNDGAPIPGFQTYSFTYASGSKFAFTPLDANVACS